MNTDTSIWLLILLALVGANLPFITERLMVVWRLRSAKSLWWRLLELVVFYFIVGGIGLGLEKHAGQIAPQGWEFYAITASLFITLAFPGFVYRYLAQRRA